MRDFHSHSLLYTLSFHTCQLQDDPNIVIAKSDATANDYPPGFEVQGLVSQWGGMPAVIQFACYCLFHPSHAKLFNKVFASVSRFPTIYWVPAGNKSRPQKYQVCVCLCMGVCVFVHGCVCVCVLVA